MPIKICYIKLSRFYIDVIIQYRYVYSKLNISVKSISRIILLMNLKKWVEVCVFLKFTQVLFKSDIMLSVHSN